MEAALFGGDASDEECELCVEGAARQRLRIIGQPRGPWRAGVALSAALLIGASGLCFVRRRGRGTAPQRPDQILGLAEQEQCHTAQRGELCWTDVHWAIRIGLPGHPEWYEGPCPGLTPASSFEEFQTCVVKMNKTSCQLPCNPEIVIPAEVVDMVQHDSVVHRLDDRADPCHTVVVGEACYQHVVQAMGEDIFVSPDKYPGLTSASSFDEFQAALHRDPQFSAICPRPCQCHDAVKGEACYTHVMWAKTIGIAGHPDWYAGVTPESTFAEIQAYLHREAKGSCAVPCDGRGDAGPAGPDGNVPATVAPTTPPPAPVVPAELCSPETWPNQAQVCGKCKVLVSTFGATYQTCASYCQAVSRTCNGAWSDVEGTCQGKSVMACDETAASATAICECGDKVMVDMPVPSNKELFGDGECHTADEKDKDSSCYNDVKFAMTRGIQEHADWYPGLTPQSSFESFQKLLHENPELRCPKPCECHTSRMGDECHLNVQWVIREGIEKHPSWYQGLTEKSRFENVQKRLHEDKNTTCPVPCVPKTWGTPSLFCVAVFQAKGYELELVKEQLAKGVGIFGCDEYAPMCDQKVSLSPEVDTLVIPSSGPVGKSKDGTAANTLVFMQAWTVIYMDARWKAHDWVIKADPDAVLVTQRIRYHLAPHTGKPVFIKNCMKWTGPGWPMMFGSLEAFTYQAMDMYYKGAQRCRDHLQWQAWGEDLFMGNCLNFLGGSADFDGALVGDQVCKGGDCSDQAFAAYHPYKSVESWFDCYAKATGPR